MSYYQTNTDVCIYIGIFILLFFLFIFIFSNCIWKESFTAPGLTLTIPPSWFPQMAAKAYNPKDSQTRMYLDRYPFKLGPKGLDPNGAKDWDYMSEQRSDKLASAYRFWKQ